MNGRRPPRQLGPAEILKLFAIIGFDPKEVHQRLSVAKNFAEFKAAMDALRADAKKKWHARAMELHPDRGGDEEKFKELQSAYEVITNLNLEETTKRPPRPRPPMGQPVVIHINMSPGGFGYTSTTTGSTTATSGSGFYPPW